MVYHNSFKRKQQHVQHGQSSLCIYVIQYRVHVTVPNIAEIARTLRNLAERFADDAKAAETRTVCALNLLEPAVQQQYAQACTEGTKEVYRTRLMLVGHFAAGKTSVKRSLLHEQFVQEHKTTDGVETQDTCVVNVDTAVNWQKGTDGSDFYDVHQCAPEDQFLISMN